ncbi:MAG: M20/M25/M40 family metallo-hydrolase, partial [Chloroflexi bacterium]|nr:M20/M25/M40 family metallo-hydrolase [Chloroflexota bacterium]
RTIRAVSRRRGLRASIDVLNRVPVAPMDRTLRPALGRACHAIGVRAPELVSGAGHDAENPALAGIPTAMLFIRSTGGSHSQRESASARDAALAASALAHALTDLSASYWDRSRPSGPRPGRQLT